MKIGILQCDEVLAELKPEHGDYPQMFERLLREVAPAWQIVTYRAVDGELPDCVNACDGYMTTGSRYGVNDGHPWIGELESFVAQLARAGSQFVGICFGHQLLARVLGGDVARSGLGWGVGVTSNQVSVRKAWMEPFQPRMDLVASHQDQVTVLPQGAEVLAGSAFCQYYMVQYDSHLMTIQGHPEYSKAYSKALMERRKDRIPAERIREGNASLSAPIDDHLCMQWIVNFFAEK